MHTQQMRRYHMKWSEQRNGNTTVAEFFLNFAGISEAFFWLVNWFELTEKQSGPTVFEILTIELVSEETGEQLAELEEVAKS